MSVNTILFDLDGTLLEMQTEPFIEQYLRALGRYVGDACDTKKLIALIWDATKAMITSQEADKTNEQVFIEYFREHGEWKVEEIWPVFEAFYRDEFPKLVEHTHPSPWAKQIIAGAKAQGFRVAVATNPVFPRDAIHHRLAWIGMNPEEFELVTVYEESHFTKPNPGYYLEICKKLGVEPSDCVMVGNHMQEDMVASKAGMKTFLVTNWMEDRGEPSYPVDQKGTLEELHQAISGRSGVFAS